MTPFAPLRPLLDTPERVEAAMPQSHGRAAVAITLRVDQDRPELLLMRRAEREDDPWSGQVSLPGGHAEEGDLDLVATAIRETREELGIELDRDGGLLGALEPIQARARGGLMDTTIAPFVFASEDEQGATLGPEAVEAFWLPLQPVLQGELNGRFTYRGGDVVRLLPCWRFEGHTVWGLTHRIVSDFLERAGDMLAGM
ncbi:MAG: CoA pyrophosphatase [Planctomycetota bacterium]